MITTPITPDLVRGATEFEFTERGLRPHRLRRHVRERDVDSQLALMEAQPSGVRVAFTTAARTIAVELHAARVSYRGTKRARGAVDVIVDGRRQRSHGLTAGDVTEIDLQTGNNTFSSGSSDIVEISFEDAEHKTVEVWLPHNETVDLGTLRSDAPVAPIAVDGVAWLHHGSSISQGSNAATPSRIWPAVAARRAGVQLHNLGFGGSALVDPFMAREIRDTPADVISVKLGINVVNLDAMRLRSFVPAVHGFLDTIREGHPDTPLLLVSPIFCGVHEDTPGPGAIDPASLGTDWVRFIATGTPGDSANGRLTLTVVREVLADIAAARSSDPHLAFLDGLSLYGATDAEDLPLPDGLHPSTEAHARIGARFADLAFRPGGFLNPRTVSPRDVSGRHCELDLLKGNIS